MPTYTLDLELLGTYLTDMPEFEIWANGTQLGPTYSISSNGTSISTSFTYGGALPSSIEFRFTDASPETPRTIEVQSVKINDRYVNTGNYLSSDNLTNGQTSVVDIAAAEDIFDQDFQPDSSEFTTGATATFTANIDFYRNITNTSDEVLDLLAGADYAHTGSGDDKIAGGAGDDFIRAGAGNDLISGGADNDRLMGQDGDDEIYGGTGNDRLFGNNGNDELHGNEGNDKLNGNAGNDLMTGGDGDDLLNGGAGNDIAFGDDGVDTLIGGAGADTLDGGAGNDLIYGGADDDQINGGDDNDRLFGNTGNDIISGDAGDDLINGHSGDDILRGGAGDDLIVGEDGADIIDGGDGENYLNGGAGIDTITSGSGNDYIHAHGLNTSQIMTVLNANPDVSYNAQTNSFYEYVSTGATWDVARADAQSRNINGVNGHLTNITSQVEINYVFGLTGGAESWIGATDENNEGDWFWRDGIEAGVAFWQGAAGGVVLNNMYDIWRTGDPNDAGAGQDHGILTNAANAFDRNETESHGYVIEWNAGLMFDDNANDIINSGAGSDHIYSYGGDDIIDAGDGGDLVFSGEGNDTVFGGAGDDSVYTFSGNDIVDGGDGNDTIIGQDGDDTLDGGDGNDRIFGENGDDIINGGEGIDVLLGGNDEDNVYGGAGNDTLFGQNGDDRLYGGEGDDVIIAGSGDDVVFGDGEFVDLTAIEVYDAFQDNQNVGSFSLIENGVSFTGNNWKRVFVDYDITASTILEFDFRSTIEGDIQGIGFDNDASQGTSSGQNFKVHGVQGYGNTTFDTYSGTDWVHFTIDVGNFYTGNFDYLTLFADDDIGLQDSETFFKNIIIYDTDGDGVVAGGDDTLTGGTGVDRIYGGGGNDTINLANGDFEAGEIIDGGVGTDEIVLTNATTIDFSTGSITTVENLVGSSGNDDVTYTIQQALAFSSINLGGGTDNSRVQANGVQDVTGLGLPVVTNAENGFLTGSTGNDDLTITGAQLDALIYGAGIIDFDTGTDILNLTSTSTNLNFLGTTDGSIVGLEEIDASSAAAAVIIDLSGQIEGFTVYGSDINVEDDTITTGSGNDIIYANNGSDTVDAGAGDDFVDGGIFADTISAGDGDDFILGGAGNDIIDGGAGNDTIYGDQNDAGDFLLEDDTITGGTGVDIMYGEVGDDIFNLANGDFEAGELIDGGSTDETAGDEIILTNATTVDFTTGTITEIENLTGSSGNDDVTYTIQQALAFSSINLGGGTDNSRVQANGIQDVTGLGLPVVTNAENGFLTGSTGNDDLTITGAQFNSLIYGAGGVNFDIGTDVIRFTSVATDLNVLAATDGSIIGLEEIDYTAVSSVITLDLSAQTEGFIISTANAGDNITGGQGDDVLSGGGGIDQLFGGLGNDILDGGTSNDDLFGGDGNDTIIGGQGFDEIYGGAGIDNIDAGTQDDRIYGGGTDFLGDTIDGGDGSDSFYIESDAFFDATVNFSNMERLVFQGNEILVTLNGTVDFNGFLVSGNSIIRGSTGIETITGTEASDEIHGGAGADILNGGGGTDFFYVSGTESLGDVYNGGVGGNDTVELLADSFFNLANTFTDILRIDTNGFDVLTLAGQGYDFSGLQMSGGSNLFGSTGDETIVGSDSNDNIFGGIGSDTLSGGIGNDDIYGSSIADHAASSAASGTVFSSYADFATNLDGYTEINDFFGLGSGAYSSGVRTTTEGGLANGAYQVTLGGVDAVAGTDMSNVISQVFNKTSATSNVYVQVTHRVDHGENFEAGEQSTAFYNLDGGGSFVLGAFINGNGNGGGIDSSGWVTTTIDFGVLATGNHTLNLGGYLTSKNAADEITDIFFDDITWIEQEVATPSGTTNIISGGAGTDELFGSTDADIFVFEAASAYTNLDQINNFNANEGDAIDISDLLVGFDSATDNIAEFLRFTNSGANTRIQVDSDGAAGGVSFSNVGQINGLTNLDEAALLANGSIIT